MSDSPQGPCQETRGFLFKHACTQSAVYSCAVCNKQVCHSHMRETESGMSCISCAKGEIRRKPMDRTRSGYYHSYDPYYYNYGYYGRHGGYYDNHYWGHHDSHDFTEADGAALANEEAGEFGGFENDPGES